MYSHRLKERSREEMRMEKVLLSIVALSGLCAVSSPAKRQYHFVYDLKNMTEAQSYCREKYTDLATIDNMEDMTILNNTVDLNKTVYLHNSYRAWIGLYVGLGSWNWSLSDTSFYKHGETEFRRWASGEPNNMNNEHCTQMYDDGLWNDLYCGGHLKAVCLYVRGPNVKFIFINMSMTWTDAQSYCRDRYTDLASVRNMTDNQKVQELVPAGEKVWIGLFREYLKWSDGSNSSFRYWRQDTREPNNNDGQEACVAANFGLSGRWEDWPCDDKRAFICYSLPTTTKQVIRLSLLKEDPSLDLNDPAVMESILKQLKQRLKDQGVNDDIKLSWKKQPDGKVFHKEKKKD
ncbi:macrophage mannose receptor 1-like isoform X1 [Sebastes umbrosus]|uniref:macrophage mannose receptor 1-like isoform X1 n=1 Tax=Sebastes umbrosus TaxID=72105 RepID=UPI00189EB026|nr:macrophage mannose receptor 1-like isoform X1 [Sebastes umbrosus]